jgi:lysophospholipase L1-like esterase
MINTSCFRRSFRAILVLLVVFATWEVCARIQDQINLGVPAWAYQFTAPRFYVHDKNGVHGIPNARFGKYAMNSLGFRGPELRADRQTILCLGASETYGVTETEGYEFPRQLERLLNSRYGQERYQVVNAGLPSERISEINAALPRILSQTHPVFAVIYTSSASMFWTDEQWEAQRPGTAAKDPPLDRFGQIRLHDHLAELIHRILPQTLNTWLADHRTKVAPARPTFLYRDATRVSRIPDANLDEYRHTLGRMIDLLVSANVRPVLMTHATRFGPNGRYRDAEFDQLMNVVDNVTPSAFFDAERRMNGVVRALAKERDIPLVDAAYAMPPGPADFADYFHFTDRGSERIASLLAQTLLIGDLRRAVASRRAANPYVERKTPPRTSRPDSGGRAASKARHRPRPASRATVERPVAG